MSKNRDAVKKMIDTNNLLREKLSPENKKYYEQLFIYIRTAGLFYDDEEVESVLYEMLQDILLAQESGQLAEEYFGKNPQETADGLIQHLGKANINESFKLIGIVFGISSVFSFLNFFTGTHEELNVLVFILNGLLTVCFVAVIFFLLHKGVYGKIAKHKILAIVLLWLFCSVTLGVFILVELLTPPILTIAISKPISITLFSLLLTGFTYVVLVRKKGNHERWLPFLPLVWILGGIGIVSMLPWMESWLEHKNGKITITVVIMLGYILFWRFTSTSLKKK